LPDKNSQTVRRSSIRGRKLVNLNLQMRKREIEGKRATGIRSPTAAKIIESRMTAKKGEPGEQEEKKGRKET